MKKLLIAVMMFGSIYSQCEGLVVSMSDSWGDGWNGNVLTIGDESFTLSSGSIGEDCYTGPMDVVVTCGGGAYQSEVYWLISNDESELLLEGGAPFEGYLESSPETPDCEYSILSLYMIDTWGDGWNGNVFCINFDCTSLYIGSSGSDEFCVDLTQENTVTCGGGEYQSEVSWTLSDSTGTILVMGGAPFEGCVGGFCESEIFELYEFDDNSQIREYYLYEPDSLADNAPLVFVLHGYSGLAVSMINYSNMNEVAADNGFAVCYPQGLTDQDGYAFWNVGYAFHEEQTVDDVAFLTSLADYLQIEHGFNAQNTFVTGFSNGGDMSYMLACQTDDIFKAIAPVAGSMMETIYDSCISNSISVFEIHGTQDNETLWWGDLENNYGWGAYYGVEDVIDYWVETNNCNYYESENIPNLDALDGSEIISHRYTECMYNNEVRLYEVINGGHDWPGSSGNMDIESSEEIWSFFSQFISNAGDVNGDGQINVIDVVQLVSFILGNTSPSENEVEAADLNGDGQLNILDVVALVSIILSD